MAEYSIDEIRALIDDASSRMSSKHMLWEKYENILATGHNIVNEAGKNVQLSGLSKTSVMNTINVALPHMTLIENTIIQNDPQWVVYAQGAGQAYSHADIQEYNDLESRAAIGKAIINYYWDRTNASDDTGHAERDALRLGKGFVKVAWNTQREEVQKDEEQFADELIEAIDLEAGIALEEGTELPEVEDIAEAVGSSETLLLENEPFVAYVSPYNIRVPENVAYVDEAPWIAEKIIVRRDFVEEDERYAKYFRDGNTLLSDVTTGNPKLDSVKGSSVFQFVEVWEFWDLVNKKMYHLQLHGDDFLMEQDIPWTHRYSPYVEFNNYKRNGLDFWGFGEMDNIAGPQMMLGELIRAQVKDLKRAGNKYFINKQYLTQEVIDGLSADKPDVAIPINKPAGLDWAEIINPVPRLSAPAEIWQYESVVEGHMRTILGLNEFQAGMSGADRMSATAAAAVDGNSVVRVQEKARSYEKGLSKVGKLIHLLAQEFLDETTAIRIGGKNSGAWLFVEPGDLYGEFGVDVSNGSTSAVNPATLAQRGRELLELIPMIQGAIADPSIRPVVEQALRLMGHNPDAILPPVVPVAPEIPVTDPAADAAAGSQVPFEVPLPEAGLTGPDDQHPVDALAALGGAPVPAATLGDIAL